MNKHIKTVLKEVKENFKAIYQNRLVNIILFGSQAREDFVEGSDIDLLVILKGNVNSGEEITRTGEINSSISLIYDTVVSCLFMSEERFLNEKSPLLMNIRKEGIVL